MSYCRFGWDGSDIYLFSHVNGFVQCCGCSLSGRPFGSTNLKTYEDAIKHVKVHIIKGDTVPADVIPELKEDIRERDAIA